MNDVIQKIYDIGIVPVIAIDDADKAVPLAKALVKGGLPAPTSISGTSATMRLMASSAAAVRNVTSAAGRPPLTRAFARGTALSASSMAMTGTMPMS